MTDETRQQLIYFGKAVRFYRRDKDLTQEKLSFKSDLHRTYIGMIERGEKNITLLNIYRLADALEIKPEQLISKANEFSV